MTRNPNQTQVGQDALIIAHPESAQIVPQDFEHAGVVDVVAHRLHLLNALSLFGAINQREMFYTYQKDEAERLYGERAPQVLQGAKANRDAMQAEAQEEYYRSHGLFEVEATASAFPDFDIKAYQAEVKRGWNRFQAAYRGEWHSQKRSQFAKSLRDGIAVEQSERHYEQEARPYISSKDQKRVVTPTTRREYPKLSSRERLIALQGDPRAGFIPKNDREKIKCFTFLDYLDNPEYPLGVTNQLIEVFIRQQKVSSEDKLGIAQRSVVSITHEIHDHWLDSITSLDDLTTLEHDLDGASPRLMLSEDVSVDHPGVAKLIRFRDLVALRDKDENNSPVSNPLRAIEDRRPHDDVTKNKTIADQYTAVNIDPEMEAYIKDSADAMTIREARKLLKLAQADERAREAFWNDRMYELSEALEERRTLPVAKLAGRLVLETKQVG